MTSKTSLNEVESSMSYDQTDQISKHKKKNEFLYE